MYTCMGESSKFPKSWTLKIENLLKLPVYAYKIFTISSLNGQLSLVNLEDREAIIKSA